MFLSWKDVLVLATAFYYLLVYWSLGFEWYMTFKFECFWDCQIFRNIILTFWFVQISAPTFGNVFFLNSDMNIIVQLTASWSLYPVLTVSKDGVGFRPEGKERRQKIVNELQPFFLADGSIMTCNTGWVLFKYMFLWMSECIVYFVYVALIWCSCRIQLSVWFKLSIYESMQDDSKLVECCEECFGVLIYHEEWKKPRFLNSFFFCIFFLLIFSFEICNSLHTHSRLSGTLVYMWWCDCKLW